MNRRAAGDGLDGCPGGIVHGSPSGVRSGCTSRGGCPLHGSAHFLTCVEAAIARHGSYSLTLLPLTQPIPRPNALKTVSRADADAQNPVRSLVHGTTWGYKRGCRNERSCPNWVLGRVTCAGARRIYVRTYKKRRLAGSGKPVQHGTNQGYLTGCRDAAECPADRTGMSCFEARHAYRLAARRAHGVQPRAEGLDPRPAAALVQELNARGLSLRRIAQLAGIGRSTVQVIHRIQATGVEPRPVSERTFSAIVRLFESIEPPSNEDGRTSVQS